jgi:TRAP-type C4-dicarboxylate transport system permease small subunit
MSVLTFLEKRLEEVIAGIGVVIMCIMVFFQVVMRYVFSLPTSWSDEIAQYCMLWSVYLSVSWAVRERAHIRVMNFINLFPLAFKNGLVVFSDFIWFIFGIFLTWHSITLNISWFNDITHCSNILPLVVPRSINFRRNFKRGCSSCLIF